MRVAVVSPYSVTKPGGVQGQVLSLARALRHAGHDAVVLAPADGPLVDTGLPDDAVVRVGRSLSVPANGSVAPLALGPAAFLRTVTALRRGSFDVIHLHEPLAPGPNYACLLRPEPKVGTFHRAGASVGYRILGPAARWAVGRLDARCAVSVEARSTALSALGGEYEVVGNGVELERFSTARPWPSHGPTVLFVGRHERRKGLGVLLDAFGRIDASLGATLWVVGDGPDTASLRARSGAAAGVFWLGRLDDDELASRLAGADVLCAPSLYGESFGIVLVEGLAARTVVVASALPGYAAVVADHGLLVAPGDVDALARALGVALSDARSGSGHSAPGALAAAAAHGSRWSMTEVAARYASVYERVVSDAHRG
ncbi:MAG: glycosyltransferase family 4 protein [Acidimicrobiales bacterium]